MLKNQLSEYIRACFTGIWIESHEHEDALADIAQLCREEEWQLATWDVEQGLQLAGQAHVSEANQDPLAAIRALNALSSAEGSGLLVLRNFHRFLQSAEIVQALARQIVAGKQNRTFVIVLAPVVQIPTELEKLFVCLEHQLPQREQLRQIAEGIATEQGELPSGTDLERVLDAASGLTRYEAEAAFSLSLVRTGQIQADAVWELKSQMLKKSGLLQLYRSTQGFDSLGGLSTLKAFCKRSLLQPGRGNPLKRARGLLLLGIPGTGKSQFAKAAARIRACRAF